ncbi:uncharacterized protein B0H18DRAFT_1123031 [Fomitopsis serialis]|uniref:uncharacterized protein n=1 Tax=Fomitopsis serialis TaxID=139415 RepID=UPI00200793DF|nr:uncharacterized protein B0H18DRAFT_1123031 [Neoantrodia serialis]KAH9918424.1 hypothetical protein B0H18DRAFT_1123031 [Neoantrodia serialis]
MAHASGTEVAVVEEAGNITHTTSSSTVTVQEPARRAIGPRRPSRSRRKIPVAPYNPASRPAGSNQQQPAHFPLPPCPRSGIQWIASDMQPRAAWEMSSKPHEAANTSVVNFLSTLTAYDQKDDIAGCADSLFAPHQASYGDKSETLSQLVKRCKAMESKRGVFDFHFMVALMRVSFECASLSGWADVNISALWRDHLASEAKPPSIRTLQYWYSRGTKLARLASGGTVYMLVWMAYTNLRVPFIEANGNLASDLANILRCPDAESPVGRQVLQTVIPTVAFLSDQSPIRLGDLFTVDTLTALGVSADSLCGDLNISDRFFSALPSNSFTAVPRNPEAWAHFGCSQREEPLSPLTPLSQLSPLLEIDRFPCSPERSVSASTIRDDAGFATTATIIASKYDADLTHNRQFKPPRHREKNARWTELQRSVAMEAMEPSSLDELRSLLQTQYVDGMRPTSKGYVRLKRDLFEDVLAIQSVQSGVIANICKSMPQSLRDGLTDRLAACLEPDALKAIDTAQVGGDHVFQVMHFSWYNRHCTTGKDAPVNVPPMTMKRTGGLKTNYHQFIPYPSKDMTQSTNASIYQSVKNILGPVFDWLDAKVEQQFTFRAVFVGCVLRLSVVISESNVYLGLKTGWTRRTSQHATPEVIKALRTPSASLRKTALSPHRKANKEPDASKPEERTPVRRVRAIAVRRVRATGGRDMRAAGAVRRA